MPGHSFSGCRAVLPAIDKGDTHWHDLYKKLKDGTTGAGETASKINGSLTYYDKAQSPVLTVSSFDISVISYEPGHDVDARAGAVALAERLTFEVAYIQMA